MVCYHESEVEVRVSIRGVAWGVPVVGRSVQLGSSLRVLADILVHAYIHTGLEWGG